MAIYTPCTGGRPDGKCFCGRPATTEIQTGYQPETPRVPIGGGQYEELCDECYALHLADVSQPH